MYHERTEALPALSLDEGDSSPPSCAHGLPGLTASLGPWGLPCLVPLGLVLRLAWSALGRAIQADLILQQGVPPL